VMMMAPTRDGNESGETYISFQSLLQVLKGRLLCHVEASQPQKTMA
jgi:hypothetical protein